MTRKSQWIGYPWISFFLIWTQAVVHGDSFPPSFLQGCDVLDHQQTIYCYGGTTDSVDVWNHFKPTAQFYSLDISQPLTPDQAKSNWKAIPAPSNGFILEPRAEFAHAMVNTTHWFITSGAGAGTNYTEPTLVNNTLLYDTTTNQWKTYNPSAIPPGYFDNGKDPIINYTVSPVTHQLLGVSACSQSNNKSGITPGVFVAGGISLSNLTLIDPNITSVYDFVLPTDNEWNTLKVSGLEKPGYYLRSFREACAWTSNFRILVFGGFAYQTPQDYPYYNNTDTASYASPFTTKGFFDIQSNTINSTSLSVSQVIPSVRYWHSLTPLPQAGKVLMYGGVFNQIANRDYCLIYDSNQKFWTLCDFTHSTIPGPGPRYGHSAVMVGSDLLYILFGADMTNQIVNDVHILNITSMVWLNSSATNSSANPTQSNVPVSSDASSSPSLSAGAIAGIVIGAVAGVSLLVVGAIIYFCAWKRKKAADEAKHHTTIQPEAPAFLTQEHTEDSPNLHKILITDDESRHKDPLLYQDFANTSNKPHDLTAAHSVPVKPTDDSSPYQNISNNPTKPFEHPESPSVAIKPNDNNLNH